jgi:dTDP-4-amino-4,6-dideoxygalactose transaminase
MIPIARPWMGDREADGAARAIASGWITQGREVAAFEQEFAAAVGSSFARAVSSCTAALHLALLSVGVRPGDEVLTVSHSFIATANAIRYCGAIPIFVDVDLATFNMDLEMVERAITPRTTAILCVHQLGMPCDLRRIVDIGRRRHLPIVEDAACAVGSQIRWDDRWERIGAPRGDVACFSFHPRKLLSTGDGGMLTTNDAALDRQFALLRQHGMSVPDTVRHASAQVIFEEYSVIGFNYRMTDIQAAVGREQLKRLPDIVEQRRARAGRYAAALRSVPGISAPVEPDWARTNWQSYAVRLAEGLDQRTVMQRMLDMGVSTRRGAMTMHREPAYPRGSWHCAVSGGVCGHGRESEPSCLARSETAQDTTVVLPLYHQMTDEEQERVVESLRHAIRE